MKSIVSLIVTAAVVWISSAGDCQPFGIRMNYGRNVLDASDPERLGVRFNTKD